MKRFSKLLTIALCMVLVLPTAVMAEEGEGVKIYLMRHGQTLFNQKEVAQGWCDSPLTALGVLQAQQAGAGLADVTFSAAYSSVSERALDTCTEVLAQNATSSELTPIIDEGLKEINFGTLEGESNVALWSPDFMTRWAEGFTEFGGETTQETTDRAMASLKAIAEANEGNVLVTSHGITVMLVATAVDPAKAGEYLATSGGGLGNCSVTIINYKDGEFTLESIGDESYRENGAAILAAAAEE